MNRKALSIFLGALVLGSVAYGAYSLGARSAAQPATTGGKSSSHEQGGRKVLYWHDPMAPGKRFDKPGKSPYMDMDLVPVYADEQPDEAAVRVSPGVSQNLGVRLAQVRYGRLGEALRIVGNVAFDERDRYLVQARGNGYVEHLYARAPMEQVRRGQPLADLYVPDWVAAQEDYLAVKRMRSDDAAAGLLDAAQQRMRLAGMTDEQIRSFIAHGTVQRRVTLTAPADGVITELGAREGLTVATGAPLFTISGLRTVWVNAEVPEAAAARVLPGTPVHASANAWPGVRFDGKVQALLPQVDQATRTLVARIELANRDRKLVPGMYVSVEVTAPAKADVLLVPTEAVIRTGTRSVVILAVEDGKFAPVEVTLGGEANGETEVLSGLANGQRVVASGQFLIDSEASLRGVLGRLEGATPQASTPAASAPAAPAGHHASGRIEKIEADEITISHGAVPTLNWGPMTMGFVPPAGGLPGGIAVGDNVDFELRARADGRYEIVRIVPAAKQGSRQQPGANGRTGHAQPMGGMDMQAPAGHAGHGMGGVR